MKLEKFYGLLVRDILLGKNKNDSGELVNDDRSDVIEISNSFNTSDNFFQGYLLRTIIEIIIAAGLFAWLIFRSAGHVASNDVSAVMCDVYGHWYECSGHPQRLYLYVLYIACFMLSAYIILSAYNLLWLSLPNIGKMSSVMKR